MGFLDRIFGKNDKAQQRDENKKEEVKNVDELKQPKFESFGKKYESKTPQKNRVQTKKLKNYGTCHSTLSKASSYWTLRRFGWKEKPQFTLFIFSNANDAKKALLELPFIHESSDGNLICDRMMEYGYYEASVGTYEAIIGGFDLTLSEYKKVEDSFTRHGGKLKNHQEPDYRVKACLVRDGNKNNVRYKETVRNNNATYEVYEADKPADAMVFLGDKSISGDSYFICVDTPQGSFAKDYIEIFQERYTTPHT